MITTEKGRLFPLNKKKFVSNPGIFAMVTAEHM